MNILKQTKEGAGLTHHLTNDDVSKGIKDN